LERLKIMVVVGTRPEGIKMAPVAKELARQEDFQTLIVSTGQHREMLDECLQVFDLAPEYDLGVMAPEQGLAESTARVLEGMAQVCRREKPEMVLVEGDTTSVVAAAQAAFYERIAVGHVEAGLRTGDKFNPFPEEINRRLVGVVADLHFAPTHSAREALLSEGVAPEKVFVTGNTVVDSLLWVVEKEQKNAGEEVKRLLEQTAGKRLILAELHRRENIGEPLASACRALVKIAQRPDVEVVFSMHRNPKVREIILRELSGKQGVRLLEPPDYISFILLMKGCHFILTDSGGIQEEAPTFGKPVLVARKVTERREGAESGASRVVGTEEGHLFEEMERLLDDPESYSRMAGCGNPYGDGKAAERIVQAILYHYGRRHSRPEEFVG
jgi:UDP-N-acetylglucosamine 2-epimerase (non-hydrolysing)